VGDYRLRVHLVPFFLFFYFCVCGGGDLVIVVKKKEWEKWVKKNYRMLYLGILFSLLFQRCGGFYSLLFFIELF
jgi:hypothetical protein